MQDTLFFFCRECDQAGYQPFLLSNTSGLQFFIKQNGTSSGESWLSLWLASNRHAHFLSLVPSLSGFGPVTSVCQNLVLNCPAAVDC